MKNSCFNIAFEPTWLCPQAACMNLHAFRALSRGGDSILRGIIWTRTAWVLGEGLVPGCAVSPGSGGYSKERPAKFRSSSGDAILAVRCTLPWKTSMATRPRLTITSRKRSIMYIHTTPSVSYGASSGRHWAALSIGWSMLGRRLYFHCV